MQRKGIYLGFGQHFLAITPLTPSDNYQVTFAMQLFDHRLARRRENTTGYPLKNKKIVGTLRSLKHKLAGTLVILSTDM